MHNDVVPLQSFKKRFVNQSEYSSKQESWRQKQKENKAKITEIFLRIPSGMQNE